MTQRYIVRLSTDERTMLLKLIEKGNSSKEKLNRARILLKADCGEGGENWKDPLIAKAFYISIKTVERIRKSLVEEGLEETLNRKLPPLRKRIIQGEEEAYLIAITCNEPPEGQARWTLTMLADKMIECKYVDSVSRDTIGRALKKNELKPWQKKEWCIAPVRNAEFVCQMEEVLDIYKLPYDSKNPVVCMDESSKQLIKEVRQPLPMKPGEVEKFDTEYERNGTASIFMAFEPLKGQRFTQITEQRTSTSSHLN